MLLYEKVYHDLFKQIANGHYNIGDLLPSEKELMQQYQCSLAPIRQAMGRLEQMGLIERLRGKGTFVKTTNPIDFRQDLVGFTSFLYDERSEWSYKTLCAKLIPANGDLAKTLEVVPGTQIVFVERVGWFKGETIQYSQHYTSHIECFDTILAERDIQSWRFLIEGKLSLNIVESRDEVYAMLAEGKLESFFPSKNGKPVPLLVIERTSLDRMGSVQEHTIFHISNFNVGGNIVKHKYSIRESL